MLDGVLWNNSRSLSFLKNFSKSITVSKSFVVVVGAKESPLLSAAVHNSVRGLEEKFITVFGV